MKSGNWTIVIAGWLALAAGQQVASAQCQHGGGGRSPGNATAASSAGNVPYSQLGMNSAYSQNTLSPIDYNRQFLMQAAAMQAQTASLMLQAQYAQNQALRVQLAQASAELRKRDLQERAAARASRQEQLIARRAQAADSQADQQRAN